MPTRARIEESDFCLTEPENWSVRKKLLVIALLPLLPLLKLETAIEVEDDWLKEVSLFL
jgi:hypothetical protein